MGRIRLFLVDAVILIVPYPACQALSRIWTVPLPFLTLHFLLLTTDDPEHHLSHAASCPSSLYTIHPLFLAHCPITEFPDPTSSRPSEAEQTAQQNNTLTGTFSKQIVTVSIIAAIQNISPSLTFAMCFGSKAKSKADHALFTDEAVKEHPLVQADRRKRKMSREERDKIKMEKGFRAMADANSSATARKCC